MNSIKYLKNKHLNKDAVILTCGKSLNEYPKEVITEFCKNKIVICIKETIIEYTNIADYFIANFERHRPFNINKNTFCIYQHNLEKIEYNNYHLIIPEDRPFIEEYTIKLLMNPTYEYIDKYNFDNGIKRPWGPGILYETVFYLCLYMGIKNVFTIGWDLTDTSKEYNGINGYLTHYFDFDTNNSNYKLSKLWNSQNFYNEMKLVNDNIIYLYNYFKKKDMNIYVVGKQSFVNKCIPRIYLN